MHLHKHCISSQALYFQQLAVTPAVIMPGCEVHYIPPAFSDGAAGPPSKQTLCGNDMRPTVRFSALPGGHPPARRSTAPHGGAMAQIHGLPPPHLPRPVSFFYLFFF